MHKTAKRATEDAKNQKSTTAIVEQMLGKNKKKMIEEEMKRVGWVLQWSWILWQDSFLNNRGAKHLRAN